MEIESSEFAIHNKILKGITIRGENVEHMNTTHMIILLDVSGSMRDDNKLENVKKSLSFLLNFLKKSDKMSLVTFNNVSNILIENMNVTPEYVETFRFTIDTLKASQGTNLSAGLLNTKSILERASGNTISKTGLILLTDGHTNEGLESNDILRIIDSMKNILPSLSITTIGYGEDHNCLLLKEIATIGGGSYNIVSTMEEVATVYGDILGGLMTTVAQNVTISYVSSWKCLNSYPTKVNGLTYLNVGDICAESETILLFENTDSSPVEVSGVLTKDFSSVQKNITFTPTITNIPYTIAYIRLTIAHILENISMSNKQYIIDTLKPIKEYLTIDHPLIPILKQEIASIEAQINGSINETNISQNLQASAFLGLSRGVARTPRVTQDNNNEFSFNQEMIHDMNITSPFSNRVQRQITQQVVSATQDPM